MDKDSKILKVVFCHAVKNNFKIFLIASVLLGLLFGPLTGLTASKTAAVFGATPPVPASAAALSKVEVVSAPAVSLPVVVKTSSQIFGLCQQPVFALQNLIQDTGVLNLNQPASCFTLTFSRPLVQKQLAVKPLSVVSTQVFVAFPERQQFYSGLLDSQSPARSLPPILPLAELGVVICLGELILKGRGDSLAVSVSVRRSTQNFFGLRILRC